MKFSVVVVVFLPVVSSVLVVVEVVVWVRDSTGLSMKFRSLLKVA